MSHSILIRLDEQNLLLLFFSTSIYLNILKGIDDIDPQMFSFIDAFESVKVR